MELSFKLESFEGPLDLLLHLIDKNKVDILDIPISLITDQYLEYIGQMETEDMNLMSDFLVMAATLLEIKSRMLLPVEKEESGEVEDPRAELVERLMQHKMFLRLSEELAEQEATAAQSFFRSESLPPEVTAYEEPVDLQKLLSGLTLQKLEGIFRQVMERQTERIDPVRSTFGTIRKEPFRVSDKVRSILSLAGRKRNFSFRELLERQATRTELIVTFLAVLELMKMGQVRAMQEEVDGEILIERTAEDQISAEDLEKAMEMEF